MTDKAGDAYTGALLDIYAALRKFGYSRLGAIRALRIVGVPLADAKDASDTFDYMEANKAPDLLT